MIEEKTESDANRVPTSKSLTTKKITRSSADADDSNYLEFEREEILKSFDEECSANIEGFPAIENWKTSVGWSIAGLLSQVLIYWGCVVAAFFCVIALIYANIIEESCFQDVATIGAVILYNIIGLIYALFIYTSFFSNKPAIKSNKAISFWNCAICGLIFGTYFNAKLTNSVNKKKAEPGWSNVTLSLLCAFSIAGCVSAFSSLNAVVQQDNSSYVDVSKKEKSHKNNAGNHNNQKQDLAVFNDEEFDYSFVIPEGWHIEDFDEELFIYDAKLSADANDDVWISYQSDDWWANQTDSTVEALLEDGLTRKDIGMDLFEPEDFTTFSLRALTDVVIEEQAETTVGDIEYFTIFGNGDVKIDKEGNKERIWFGQLLHVEHGNVVIFYLNTRDENDYKKYLPTLLEVAESVDGITDRVSAKNEEKQSKSNFPTVASPKNMDSSKLGWVKYKDHWYYQHESGKCATGIWTINKDTYWFDSKGIMQTGWYQQGSNWGYFGTSGKLCSGWKKINGSWYYLGNKGVMQTGWLSLAGEKYYLNSDGIMQIGWSKIDGSWYHFKSDGAMETGWIKVNDSWYFLNSSGIMQTSKIVDDWYLDENGVGHEPNYQNATKLVGTISTISGPVTSIYHAAESNGSPWFIDIGSYSSNKTHFTIVIWSRDRANYQELLGFLKEGYWLEVTGYVSEYNGVPEFDSNDGFNWAAYRVTRY